MIKFHVMAPFSSHQHSMIHLYDLERARRHTADSIERGHSTLWFSGCVELLFQLARYRRTGCPLDNSQTRGGETQDTHVSAGDDS